MGMLSRIEASALARQCHVSVWLYGEQEADNLVHGPWKIAHAARRQIRPRLVFGILHKLFVSRRELGALWCADSLPGRWIA
jgi:hypothetical protein